MTEGIVHAWKIGKPDPVVEGTAGELMSTPPITTSVETPAEQALRLMRHHDVHHLLLEDRGRVVAVVSDRDLARGAASHASAVDERRAQRPAFQVAQFHLINVPQGTPIEEAARTLLLGGVSSLPVVNEAGEVAGILTSRDLLRYLAFGHLRRLWAEAS